MTPTPPYDPSSVTHGQRALCDTALLQAQRTDGAITFAHSHDGAELVALLTRTTAIPGYLAGGLVTPEGAQRLVQLCRALSHVTSNSRARAELHVLRALAYLGIARPGMAELHAGAALVLRPTHTAASRLMQELRGQPSSAKATGIARRAYATMPKADS